MSKLFVCLAVLVACASANNIPQPPIIDSASIDMNCPMICPALHAPVCATRNEKVYQMFNNACELRMANCNRPRDIDSIKDLIPADPFWCTSEEVGNLIDKLEQLDVDINTPSCTKPCPMIYSPVCVSNGQFRGLLSNDCLLDGLNCAIEHRAVNKSDAPKPFKVLRHDSC